MAIMDHGEQRVVQRRYRAGHVDHGQNLLDSEQGRRSEGIEHPQQHGLVGVGPSEKQIRESQLLAPHDPHSEDDRHRPGDEERQGEQVDPIDPEHRRPPGREQEVRGNCHSHQRQADRVVDKSVVDGRLGFHGPRSDRRQRQSNGRYQAYVRQGSVLARTLEQSGERVVVGDGHDDQQQGNLQRGPCTGGCVRPPSVPVLHTTPWSTVSVPSASGTQPRHDRHEVSHDRSSCLQATWVPGVVVFPVKTPTDTTPASGGRAAANSGRPTATDEDRPAKDTDREHGEDDPAITDWSWNPS